MNRVVLVLFLGCPITASAAGYIVDPAGGADTITIGAAIDLAQSGDTIRVAPGTYYETLNTAGKDLSILSQDGPEVTTISGAGRGVLFTIDQGESISLEGFTLREADQALEMVSSSVQLIDIDVTRMNETAIHLATGAELSGRQVTLSLNGTEGMSGSGGAIHVRHSQLTLTNSILGSNTASKGGGIYGYDASVTLSSVDLTNNSASTGGGGLFLEYGSTLDAAGLNLSGNSGPYGGGLVLQESEATWSLGQVSDNKCDGDGGGLFLLDSAASLDLTVSGNTADTGGGLYAEGSSLRFSGALSGNAIFGRNGGGAYVVAGALTLVDATVSENTATTGAGVWTSSSTTTTLTRGEVRDNTAAGDGGGLRAGGPLSAKGTVFARNSAAGLGGGLYALGALTLDAVSFRDNSADTGGGLATTAATEATDLLLETNRAITAGGGLYHQGDGALELRGGSIEGQTEALVISAASVLIEDVTFRDNAVSLRGAQLPEATIRRARFIRGEESISLVDSADVSISSCAFLGSSVAGVHASGGAVTLSNVDLVGNLEGVVLEDGASAEIVNTIAVGNSGAIVADASSSAVVRYSDLWGNGDEAPVDSGADGNISEDPAYYDFSDDGDWDNDIFLLTDGSPCRDAGDPALLDRDGSPSDMGVYGGPDAESVDADGDGFPVLKGDCDDSDPTINPGAEEIWYDGIDQDCASDDDFDQDGDGFQYQDAEGVEPDEVDCDDTDPETHPGAHDPRGDNIDQNCDGEDGLFVNDDPDKDGDGYAPEAGDCNDDDPTVNPSVSEICLDSRDNNCDGLTDGQDPSCAAGGCGCAQGGGRTPGLILLLPLLGLLRRRR